MSRAAYFTFFVVVAAGFSSPSVAAAADNCPGICPLGHVCVQDRCVPESEAPPPVTTPTPPPTPPPTPTPPPPVSTTTGTSTIPIETQTSVPITHGVAPVAPVPSPDVDPWERLFSITIDPLGFLLYGPSLKFEVGTFITGYARVRVPNAGLVHVAQNIGDTEFDWGFSAGGGIRGYIGRESQQGFLMGAGFEIAHTVRRSDSENTFGESAVRWGTTSFLPGLEIGYRIVTTSGFTFTVAGGAFYIINLGFSAEGTFSDIFRDEPEPTEGEVWPVLQLDLGYTF